MPQSGESSRQNVEPISDARHRYCSCYFILIFCVVAGAIFFFRRSQGGRNDGDRWIHSDDGRLRSRHWYSPHSPCSTRRTPKSAGSALASGHHTAGEKSRSTGFSDIHRTASSARVPYSQCAMP